MSEISEASGPYVVGIGASAGGLEALEAFFKSVPPDCGLAFVVVQHLSPDFKSLMNELLARYTTIRVSRVDKEVSLRPNTIYLIPPKKDLAVKGCRLLPIDQSADVKVRLPVDHFFRSLAAAHGSKSIGVVMSGTGRDGTGGCTAIREVGGLVIAQDPSSCRFEGMPRSIIRHSLQDVVLPPAQMIEHILKHTNRCRVALADDDLEHQPDKLRVITDLLKTVEGLDFSQYRPSTIARRTQRRVKIHHLLGIDDYIHLLKDNRQELGRLHGELLIGVTNFFRDKHEFRYLRSAVIPRIIRLAQERGDDTIRVWIAGCSTGEEAYSIAISIMEYLDSEQISLGVKVFATDVDHQALEVAVTGEYPERILEDLGQDLAKKYFLRRDGGFRACARLRSAIVFSRHDATQDPPFTRMHLISCRNVLIYFQPELQAKSLSLFHFGLATRGILFLGKSESLGNLHGEFRALSPDNKMFEKIRDVRLPLASDIGTLKTPLHLSGSIPKSLRKATLGGLSSELGGSGLSGVHEAILNRYMPPCVLVDEHYDLLHVFADASRFLEFPVGKSTLNVLKILNPDVSLALGSALARCAKTSEEVLFTGIESSADHGKSVDIRVEPFELDGRRERAYLVTFDEQQRPKPTVSVKPEVFDKNVHCLEQVSNLEDQLRGTRETLQSTIEELETTNEELQSANEELMSSNEELQSSNEELQSVNEELFTVNAEYQSKIDEISQVNRDIDFLLSSSRIAMVFLDEDLKIRRFNKEMRAIVGVLDHDIGRRISDLTFSFCGDQVISQVLRVAKSGVEQAQEIRYQGVDYLVKAVPYPYLNAFPDLHGSTKKSRGTGVVLSFVDVSAVKEVGDLRRLNEDAEEFSYIVSHDLQRPIRGLMQYASAIIDDVDTGDDRLRESISESARGVGAELDLLTKMHDQLLSYSRLRTRGGEFRPFQPEVMIHEVLARMRHDVNHVDVTMNILPKKLHGDFVQFKELFRYLLENCVVHHTHKSKLRITITTANKGGAWEFSVGDNGSGFVGIAPSKAFELFRGDPDKRKDGCLGVGLALSRRIVHRHGGEIWVQSSSDKGSTVRFTLPEEGDPKF